VPAEDCFLTRYNADSYSRDWLEIDKVGSRFSQEFRAEVLVLRGKSAHLDPSMVP
jgi:hypothetical protein